MASRFEEFGKDIVTPCEEVVAFAMPASLLVTAV